ncbi:protein NAR1 isoform X2 [Aristolochia californica]|uniref:protein NAR1 isoform X2 n=1 Tax=Aristolochia californica TaxID=171875 RepID=UPI0035DD1843
MSEKFSPTLRLADLNDFIAPSQACIVSLKAVSASKPEKDEKREKVLPFGKLVNSEPVKISLKDCLACSGCITSAETVMLEKQSSDEFLSRIKSETAVVVSISPQSRASLAVYFGLSPSQVFKKLTTFFKSLGVKAVFDTSCSRDLVLIESCNEFIERYEQHKRADGEETVSTLPMLSSSCPGWICYAEKTLGSYILPYISSVKSPQQAMGTAIKHHISKKMGFMPQQVYHVTVMPCYDKKLEAVRDDFVFPVARQGENVLEATGLKIAEVDSVLTSGEVLDLMQLKSIDFNALEDAPLDKLLTNINGEGLLYGVAGSSGGYAETIFRYAAKTLFGKEIRGSLEFKVLRNSDFHEVHLEVGGETVLRFATCYGFRNLQNVVRKIRSGRCEYHFVEVMACPSGCLNGGGQIKPKTGQSAKDLIQSLETTYQQDVVVADPGENPIVRSLYDEWLGEPGSEKAKRYIHTKYHPVTKSITSQLHNW